MNRILKENLVVRANFRTVYRQLTMYPLASESSEGLRREGNKSTLANYHQYLPIALVPLPSRPILVDN